MNIKNKQWDSWSATDADVIAERQRENDIFGQFEGKKVKIGYGQRHDWSMGMGEKTGRILKKEDGQWFFLPTRCRKKGYHLTLGLDDGCWATLTINEITEL